MNASSILVLLVVGILLALAIRSFVRKGACDCSSCSDGDCSSCNATAKMLEDLDSIESHDGK